MPGMASTVSVLCVRRSLCHVLFFLEKPCVLFLLCIMFFYDFYFLNSDLYVLNFSNLFNSV